MKFLEKLRSVRIEFHRDLRLAQRINQHYQLLLRSLGNQKEVIKQSKELNALIDHVQQTKLYGFIYEDVERIKVRMHYIRAHPKENKLAYVAAGAYIIVPGTFELTGVYLFLRYSWKYVFSFRKRNH